MRWIDYDRCAHGRACVALCSNGHSKVMKDRNDMRNFWVIEEMSKVLTDNSSFCDQCWGIIYWVSN